MANKYSSLSNLFTDIAGAIRGKTGDTNTIVATEFPSAVRGIAGGVEEISTDDAMAVLPTASNVGKFYKFTGTTGTYANGAYYMVSEVTTISFTITYYNETFSYQAEEGMTWEEWVNSNYGTGYTAWNGMVRKVGISGSLVTLTDGSHVKLTDLIISDYEYTLID